MKQEVSEHIDTILSRLKSLSIELELDYDVILSIQFNDCYKDYQIELILNSHYLPYISYRKIYLTDILEDNFNTKILNEVKRDLKRIKKERNNKLKV